MTPDGIIVLFLAHGANDALRGLMTDYGRAFEEFGRSILNVEIGESVAELRYATDLMQKGQVDFCMTWLGIGQDLSFTSRDGQPPRNAFELTQVPLLKIQGDLPAYLPDRHRDVPCNSANLYQADEFVQFRDRFIPEARSPAFLLPPMPMVPVARSSIDVSSRRAGKLVFLKNGNSPAALRELWRERLPASLASHALGMADAIGSLGLLHGPFYIGDFVVDYLRGAGYRSAPPRSLVFFFSAQMDDYLRRVKSTMIAEALLDFPVIVQGSFWKHVDFSGKRARLVEGEDVDVSHKALSQQLGVIDMSANTDSWPHDRVQRGAGSYSLVLTNRQGWLSRSLSEFDDLTFDFRPESIRERVADVLAKPDKYLDLAVAFGERFREVYPREAFVRRSLELIEVTRLLWSTTRPPLQEFYGWPPPGWD
jgi:hypothetical protein